MKTKFAAFLAIFVLLVTVGSDDALARKKKGDKLRESTLYDYEGTVRWSEFDKAAAFLDGAWLVAHPVTALDMSRYKQVRVTGYDVRAKKGNSDGTFEQVVEIRLINVNTQVERTIVDHQIWRWDEPNKHWWLTTGLPDITAAE